MQPVSLADSRPLGAPRDWDPARDGECGVLHVRIETPSTPGSSPRCVSRWRPSPEDLALLAEGGSLYLSCVGGQPPVGISAERLQRDLDHDQELAEQRALSASRLLDD